MILDSGICTIHRLEDTAPPGDMPREELVAFHESWYGELSFASGPEYETGHREDVAVSKRIRILQNQAITNLHVVTLGPEPGKRYEVTRAFHGTDDDSGTPISDLSLKAVSHDD